MFKWLRSFGRKRERTMAALTSPVSVDPDDPGFARFGPVVNGDKIPAAWACITVLSDSLARLPLFVRGRRRHTLAPLLQRPSDTLDAVQCWTLLFRAAVATGNGYAVIMRRPSGEPRALMPCVAAPVVTPTAKTYNVTQYYGLRGPQGVFAERDVVAIQGPGFDGISSPSPIVYAAQSALKIMTAANTHNSRSLLGGMNGRAALAMDPQLAGLSPAQRDEIRHAIAESYAGARNADRVPVLPPGVTPAQMGGISAVDMQLIELMRWTVEDICRVFGVPPRMVGHQSVGMRVETKLGQQGEDFFRWSLSPWIARITAQLSAKLLSRDDYDNGVRIGMNADVISQGTFAERVDAIDQAVAKAGVLTINEGRSILGYGPIDDGDRLIAPAGTPGE